MITPKKIEVKPTSFGIFNKIYSSSLTFLLKHHYACRELCLRYNAMAATIFLYDGEKDKLLSKATYLHRQGIKNISPATGGFDVSQFERMHIMRFIGFYHYVFFGFISTGIPRKISDKDALSIFETFKRKTHLSYGFPSKLEIPKLGSSYIEHLDTSDNSIIRFVQYCIQNSRKHAADHNGKIDSTKFYFRLHKTLEEEYDIGEDPQSFSGKVFHLYRDAESFSAVDCLLFETESNFKTSNHKNDFSILLTRKLESLGFSFKVKPYFVGLPLLVNGRCIGIIRLLYYISPELGIDNNRKITLMKKIGDRIATENNSSSHPKILYAADKKKIRSHLNKKGINRSLLYSIQMIGHFIDSTFPEVYIQSKPKNFVSKENLHSIEDSRIYNRWCTDMRNALNSHDCSLIIRDYSSQISSRIGFSDNISDFERIKMSEPNHFLIKNDKFNGELEKVFPEVNVQKHFEQKSENRKAIAAFIIDFNENLQDTKILSYYYTEEKDELRRINDATSLSHSFKNINAADTLNNGKGLINLTYHSNFTKNSNPDCTAFKGKYKLVVDIPAPDVCGVVVFSNSINRKFTLLDVKFAFAQVKRLGLDISLLNRAYTSLAVGTAIHPLRQLIRALDKIIEIADVGQPIDKEKTYRLKILRNKYEYRVNAFLMWLGESKNYIKQQTKEETIAYLLSDYLTQKINEEYLEEAKAKGILIDIKLDHQVKNLEITLNKKGLWNCIDGIIGNAVERAYDSKTLTNKNIPGFKENTLGVCGNITIELKKEKEYLRIEVSNCGIPIEPKIAKSLGYFYNSDESNNDSVRGLGLFIVKEHLAFLKSEWVVPWATENGTTFCVRIKL